MKPTMISTMAYPEQPDSTLLSLLWEEDFQMDTSSAGPFDVGSPSTSNICSPDGISGVWEGLGELGTAELKSTKLSFRDSYENGTLERRL
jgi:hypothetical protein